MSWQEFWNQIVNYFQANIWNIVGFVLTLVLGLVLIKVIMMILKAVMKKRKVDHIAANFIAALVRFFLLVLYVLILLSMIGVPVTGLTTTVSAAVLAIGVALKEFLSNVAGGLILVGSNKYKMGDYLQVAGVEGSIVDINFLFTTLQTPDNTNVTLPNSTMVNSSVTNLWANPKRRVAIDFSVAYESDTELVKKTLLDVMLSCGLVYKDPAPLCRLKKLNTSSIDYFLTCYCDSQDYWDVYYYIMEYAFDECKRVGINFPFPQVELTQKEKLPMPVAHEKLPERVEKKRTESEDLPELTMDEWENMTLKEMSERRKLEKEYSDRKRKKKKAAEKEKKEKESAKAPGKAESKSSKKDTK